MHGLCLLTTAPPRAHSCLGSKAPGGVPLRAHPCLRGRPAAHCPLPGRQGCPPHKPSLLAAISLPLWPRLHPRNRSHRRLLCEEIPPGFVPGARASSGGFPPWLHARAPRLVFRRHLRLGTSAATLLTHSLPLLGCRAPRPAQRSATGSAAQGSAPQGQRSRAPAAYTALCSILRTCPVRAQPHCHPAVRTTAQLALRPARPHPAAAAGCAKCCRGHVAHAGRRRCPGPPARVLRPAPASAPPRHAPLCLFSPTARLLLSVCLSSCSWPLQGHAQRCFHDVERSSRPSGPESSAEISLLEEVFLDPAH